MVTKNHLICHVLFTFFILRNRETQPSFLNCMLRLLCSGGKNGTNTATFLGVRLVWRNGTLRNWWSWPSLALRPGLAFRPMPKPFTVAGEAQAVGAVRVVLGVARADRGAARGALGVARVVRGVAGARTVAAADGDTVTIGAMPPTARAADLGAQAAVTPMPRAAAGVPAVARAVVGVRAVDLMALRTLRPTKFKMLRSMAQSSRLNPV